MKFSIYNPLFMLLVTCTACQVGPSYSPTTVYAPADWKNEHPCENNPLEDGYWWEIFKEDALNDLMSQALNNNNDIYAALERVIQARAMAGIAESNLYPQLTVAPNYSAQDILTKIFIARPPTPSLLREHQILNLLPLNLTYELDLWGRILSTYQSATAFADAQTEALRDFLLILTTDLANSYFHLRTIDKEIVLYLQTIEVRKQAVDITTARYEGQIVNYSDVSRARLELANVQADYYDAMRQRDIEVNRIAVLIGTEASDFTLPLNPLEFDPPSVPVALPSTIVQQRPDIAEAERELASQHALVRVAYANYFPVISLTGTIGSSSPDLTHFLKWKSRYWSMGAGAVQTAFDAGRTDYNLTLAWANFNEADADYRQTVLTAFQEVEDALNNIQQFNQEATYLSESVKAAKTTTQIAQDRYFQGVTFYLDVVDSQRDELDAERSFINVQGNRFAAAIQLIKALGGSWDL